VPIVGPLIGGPLGAYVYDALIGSFLPQAEPEVGRAGPSEPEAGGRPVEGTA
jgi:glycerol uptake facilitator protein